MPIKRRTDKGRHLDEYRREMLKDGPGAMLLAGCDGGTHATSGVVPELTRSIYDAVAAGQMKEAFTLQRTLTEIFDPLIQGADFPEGFRLGVELRGFKMGASRQPATESQLADRRKLAERLRTLLAGRAGHETR